MVGIWGSAPNGFAIDPLMSELGLIWALTRLQIRMIEYPKWGDMITITTSFSQHLRSAAMRDFLIKDLKTQKLLGVVSSIWVCVNTNSKKMIRIPDEVKGMYYPFVVQERESLIPKGEEKLKIEDVDLDKATNGRSRFAGHMNLDMNNHINNVAYMSWALDLVPDEVFQNYRLAQVPYTLSIHIRVPVYAGRDRF